MMEYRNFAGSGIKDHSNPFNNVKAGIIFGKEDFVEKITEIIKGKSPGSELPALKKLHKTIPIDNIVERVSDYYSLSEAYLRKRSIRYLDQRKVAIYLSKSDEYSEEFHRGKTFWNKPSGCNEYNYGN
jgi:hypothetical protein